MKNKNFNITGTCVASEDYMVDITGKLFEIKKMIDAQEYFTINRGRQYGKTTTLHQLESFLQDEYIVISISFEGMGTTIFQTEEGFCQELLNKIHKALSFLEIEKPYIESWKNKTVKNFSALSEHITNMCKNRKIVLMIDEVDKASNHFVFIDFLGKLSPLMANKQMS